VPIQAHGLSFNWLYDTGADISVMSLRKFKEIPPDKRPPRLPVTLSLKSAGKTPITVAGVYLMSLSVLGHSLRTPIYVCDNLNQDALLGMDVIEKLGLALNPKSKQFDFKISAISAQEVHSLATTSAQTLPPLSVSCLKLAALHDSGTRAPLDTKGLAVVGTSQFPLLSGDQV
jgi:Retroviral aspartyl protease.